MSKLKLLEKIPNISKCLFLVFYRKSCMWSSWTQKTYCNYLLNTSDLNNNYSISTGNNNVTFFVSIAVINGTTIEKNVFPYKD